MHAAAHQGFSCAIALFILATIFFFAKLDIDILRICKFSNLIHLELPISLACHWGPCDRLNVSLRVHSSKRNLTTKLRIRVPILLFKAAIDFDAHSPVEPESKHWGWNFLLVDQSVEHRLHTWNKVQWNPFLPNFYTENSNLGISHSKDSIEFGSDEGQTRFTCGFSERLLLGTNASDLEK